MTIVQSLFSQKPEKFRGNLTGNPSPAVAFDCALKRSRVPSGEAALVVGRISDPHEDGANTATEATNRNHNGGDACDQINGWKFKASARSNQRALRRA